MIHLNLVRAVNYILEVLQVSGSTATTVTSSSLSYRSTSSLSTVSSGSRQANVDSLRGFKIRLSPLRQVELILHRRICVDSNPGNSTRSDRPDRGSSGRTDLSVKVRSGWKALARVRRPTSSASQDELQDTRQIIDACRDDILALWADDAVQAGLRERKFTLEDHYV